MAPRTIPDQSQRPTHSRALVLTALGVGQILGWGSTYYLPAVLAKPIAAETGWPLAWVVAGLTVGSLTAGLIAPRVGRAIQAHGGRTVMAAGAVLLALGRPPLASASASASAAHPDEVGGRLAGRYAPTREAPYGPTWRGTDPVTVT
jgi:MFS family permease